MKVQTNTARFQNSQFCLLTLQQRRAGVCNHQRGFFTLVMWPSHRVWHLLTAVDLFSHWDFIFYTVSLNIWKSTGPPFWLECKVIIRTLCNVFALILRKRHNNLEAWSTGAIPPSYRLFFHFHLLNLALEEHLLNTYPSLFGWIFTYARERVCVYSGVYQNVTAKCKHRLPVHYNNVLLCCRYTVKNKISMEN